MFCNGCGHNLAHVEGASCPNCGAIKPAQAQQGSDSNQGYAPQQGHGAPGYPQPPTSYPPPYGGAPAPGYQPGKGKAIASLVLGICAIVVPIPILDIIMGVLGLVLASMSKNEGFNGGIRTGGLVCSIIGTVFAVIFTISCLATCGAATSMWWLF